MLHRSLDSAAPSSCVGVRKSFSPSLSSHTNASALTQKDSTDSKPMLSNPRVLDEFLSNPNLPSPPAVALQIVDLASNPDTDIRDIVRLLKVDPGICAKLLKTVNSCFYGLRKPVATIERAVSVIGFHPLRSLVLGMAIPSLQSRSDSDEGLRGYWRTSVAGAMIVRELAIRARDSQAEEIFLAGLLRNLGMPLLRERFGSMYDPVWQVAERQGARLWGSKQCAWERSVLGLDHAELSAALLARWNLPKEVVQMVRYHHEPDATFGMDSRVRRASRMLDFASQLAKIEYIAEDAATLREVIRLAKIDYDLSVVDLEQFLELIAPKITEFAEILDVEIGSCATFAATLATGCAALAQLSVELTLSHSSRYEEQPQPETERCSVVSPPGTEGNAGIEIELLGYSLDFIERLNEPGFEVFVQNYRIKEVLGRGGMGVVLKAFEPGLDRFVALKMITPQLASESWIRDRFAEEARTAASILHENVVTIFTIGKYQGVSFLVMECVEGLSVQDHLKTGRRFQAAEIARIGHELALGLAAAHRLGVIHRDVKPGNVLLRREGERALLTDFGLACVLREKSAFDSTDSVWGTPEYMSPEQSRGDPVNFATDLYSLGGTLFALCTNLHPLPWAARREFPDYSITSAIRRANAEIPDTLARVIARLLAPLPEDRYSSAEEAAKVLRLTERLLN